MKLIDPRRLRIILPVALFVVVAPLVARADGASPATTQVAQADDARFLRFVGDGDKGGTLQTSEADYKNDAGVTIRLVSAVHIGEPAYFHDIQNSFTKCDAVLYEMVKPKDSGPPQKGVHSDHFIAQLQRFLKDRLDLSYQLDEIDYNAPNFVHADLDAETFQELQTERGESFAQIFLNSLMKSITDPGAIKQFDDEPTDVVDLMTRPDGDRQLKLLIGRHLGDIERTAGGLDALNGTVILTERNKAVIKKLDETLKSGKKDIAIFYGAAHMPDLSSQIEAKGFKHVSTKWRPAWDATIRSNEPSAFEKLMGAAGKQLLDSLKEGS